MSAPKAYRVTISVTPLTDTETQQVIDDIRARFGRKPLIHVIGRQPSGAHLKDAPGADREIPEAAVFAANDLSYGGKRLTRLHAKAVLEVAAPHLTGPLEQEVARLRAEREALANEAEDTALPPASPVGDTGDSAPIERLVTYSSSFGPVGFEHQAFCHGCKTRRRGEEEDVRAWGQQHDTEDPSRCPDTQPHDGHWWTATATRDDQTRCPGRLHPADADTELREDAEDRETADAIVPKLKYHSSCRREACSLYEQFRFCCGKTATADIEGGAT